ncbi:MAG: 2-alkenal reductase [Deltaproteobacteria bacterium 13_1_40CM_4_68_19]|nr:MAG: 2-alkenal reductase [Deltaproteobacteria bacterium 13_1_40CM_4_68_19]OLD35897.1 MAG: 2-alkenal reductase [Myxococcales bacterium 13_1_40CM_2_68_15]
MPADKPILLGIDLGTTNTCVAYVRNKVARVVPSDKGSLILPSVVAMSDKGDLLVGNVAKDQMVVNPRNTIYGAKRLIGRQYNSKVVQDIKHYFSYEIVEGPNGEAAVVLAGKVYSLPQISAFVLQHCKRVAEATLGQEITEAIISVPAYYNDNQRNAVKEAGLLAGFNVKRIVNEPTAAALAYGLNRGFDHKVLVYDLGGGTFDVSVLQLHGNVMEVLATGGDTFLGGVDFDNRIIDYVLEEFRTQTKIDLTQSPIAMQRIKNGAEAAKIDLSLLSNVVIELPYVSERKGKPVDLRIPISRERINALVMDLVDKSFQIVERVLGEKNLNRGDIQEVLLVGGQTRMPLVQGKAHQFFGKPPRKGVHPDESVALGAALLAESMQEIDSVTLVDALSMPIGFAMPGGRFRKVIEKNIQIPSKSSFRLPPARDGRGLELDIFQGDSDRIIDNEYLGTLKFPAEVAGQRVNFILDEECLLHVTIESASGDTRELTLATKDTPEALKVAWQEEAERRRIDAERQALTPEEQSRGLFASIRKVFGGQ